MLVVGKETGPVEIAIAIVREISDNNFLYASSNSISSNQNNNYTLAESDPKTDI